ncbi:MAG: gliding motility lipoprotein GldH [Bacteroidales bacterium]|nr:gliding motility lipoprotein GldH [Bacteroidales bacterium]
MKKQLYLVAALSAAVLSSCNPGRIYSDRVSLAPDMVWDMDNAILLEADIADTNQLYDISLDIRTVDFYPYANMWLFVKTTSPSGVSREDTIECILRDEKGFSTSNRMCFGEVEDYEIPFANAAVFHDTGKFKFQIRHGMRMEKLPFVNEVGMSIDIHKQ